MGSPLGNWGKFPQMCVRYSGALFGRNCPLGCTVEKLKTHHSAIRAIKAIILYFEIFSLIGEFGRIYITWRPGNVLNLNQQAMHNYNVLKRFEDVISKLEKQKTEDKWCISKIEKNKKKLIQILYMANLSFSRWLDVE